MQVVLSDFVSECRNSLFALQIYSPCTLKTCWTPGGPESVVPSRLQKQLAVTGSQVLSST